jgi:CheY-like chemotaxis protein
MSTSTNSVLSMPEAPADNRFRLLIVESDEPTSAQILAFLEKTGFQCHVATSNEGGMTALIENRPHLLVLGTNSIDSEAFCRWVRATNSIPIIVIGSSDTGAEISALKIGADDYLGLPLRPAVLMARVVSALRRAYRYNAPPKPKNPFGFDEGQQESTGPRLPSGWAQCELCDYRGPRFKFEGEDFMGNPKIMCPNCKETDHIIFSLD